MSKQYDYIRILMDKFFEGQSSNSEESELYDFFNQKDIPDDLKKYKEIFLYFEKGIIADVSRSNHVSETKKIYLNRKWIIGLSIAASVIIIFFIKMLFFTSNNSFNPYEGSYLIRNGERIEDIFTIQEEEQKIKWQIKEKLMKNELMENNIQDRLNYYLLVENEINKKMQSIEDEINSVDLE